MVFSRKNFFLLILLLSVELSAQQIVPTADKIAVLSSLLEPRISPDGEAVAFIVESKISGKTELWIHYLRDPQPKSLGSLFTNPAVPRWSPDGKHLAIIAEDSMTTSNQVFVYSREGGLVKKITDAPQGVVTHAWRPDSKALAFVSPKRTGEIIPGATFVDELQWVNHLYEVEMGNGQKKTIYDSDHVSDFAYSPDGTQILIKASNSPTDEVIYRSRLLMININTKEIITLAPLMGDTPDGSQNMHWSPDGKQIMAFLPAGKFKKTIRPEILNLGDNTWRPVFENYRGYIISVEWYGEHAAFTAYDGTKSVIGLYDLKQSKISFAKEVGVLGPVLSSSYKGNKLAYIYGSHHAAPNVWVCNSDGTSERKLTSFDSETGSWEFGTEEVVSWKSKDGVPIEGVLLKPKGKRDEKLPLIVMIHGGPEWAWVKGWDPEAHFFVNLGFAVLKPNIRGSQGYGIDFIEKNYLDLGGGDFEDVVSAIPTLVSRGWVDPKRVAIEGWSHGGFVTAWAISHSDLFKAAVVGAGPVNLDFQYRTTDNRIMWEYYMQTNTYENQAKYRFHSPMTYIDKIKTPTLIIHGTSDARVPYLQAVQLYNGLKHYKTQTRLLLLEGERHGIRKPSNRALILNPKKEWYSKYLIGDVD